MRSDGTEINRREAFAVAVRYCGKQEWSLLKESSESEVYTSGDRSYCVLYRKPVGSPGTNLMHLVFYPAPKGLEAL